MGNYCLFLSLAEPRGGTWTPERRMKEVAKEQFFMENEVFWGSGPPWGPGLEPGGPKE